MKKFLLVFMCMLNTLWASAQFSGSGSGTASDPYLIFNPTQLAQMANFLDNSNVVFELKNDIDLTEFIDDNYPIEGWAPIGVSATPFKGTFKGNNRTISGLSINRPNTANVGFFGYIVGAKVSDLKIVASTVKAAAQTGVLAGTANNATFTNVSVTITNAVHGTQNVGGMVGSTCSNFASCAVTGKVVGTSTNVGGMVGSASSSTFNACTQTGDVTGVGHVGGICGHSSSTPTFTDCKAQGTLVSTADYIGGILGYGDFVSMTNCSHFGDIQGTNYVGGVYGGNPPQAQEDYPRYAVSSSYYAWTNTNEFEPGFIYTVILNKCAAIGNVSGRQMVGGLVGSHEVGRTFRFKSASGQNAVKNGNEHFLLRNGTNTEEETYYTLGGSKYYYTSYSNVVDYVDYITLNVSNSSYSGNVTGTDDVGGLIGNKISGEITSCYAYANVVGETNVGGLIGKAASMPQISGINMSNLTIKSSAAINTTVNATKNNVGRIYGYKADDYVTIGALGTAEGNLSLNKTRVVRSGVVQTITDDLQNGTSIGPAMLKLKATYVAKGWNFDNDWTIQETESYPYMRYQTAPPVIESNLVSQATSVNGKSVDGGTVYLYYKNNTSMSQDCSGSHNWAFTTEPLQSGAEVRLYAEADGLIPSYFTTATVAYLGSGTEDAPYLIYSAADLQGVSKQGYYKLMNDIDLTAWIAENSPTKGWISVGHNGLKATHFDGDGHKITGLWTNTTDDYTGLFSNFSSGSIKNLTVEVAAGKKVKGGDCTGILIGYNANGTIQNVIVKGDVQGTFNVGGVMGYSFNNTIDTVTYEGSVADKGIKVDNSYRTLGGIAGYAHSSTLISCRVNVSITASDNEEAVGGIFGEGYESIITKTSVNCNINTTGIDNYVGGLVGGGRVQINQSFSTGVINVSGIGSTTGGLIGANYDYRISNCYSTVSLTGTNLSAGLVGECDDTIDMCYAKGDVLGVLNGAGVVAQLDGTKAKVQNSVAVNNQLTFTDQSSWASRVIGGYKNGAADPDNSNYALKSMQVTLNGVPQKKYDDLVEGIAKEQSILQTSAFYKGLGWDFENVWGIDEGTGYPYLLWERETEEPQYVTGDANGDNKVTVLDYLGIAKYILQGAFDGFNAQAADVNEDEKITVLDYLGVAKIILNGSLNSNHRVNAAALDLSSDCLTADAADGVLAIGLNNAGDYSMFQLDVTLPPGATLVEVEGTERMSGNHTIDFAHQHGTTWRILVGSRSLATVKGFEGDILRLNVSGLTDGEVIIDNAEFVTPAAVSTTMRPLSIYVAQPTGISNLLSTPQSKIYNLQGMRVNASQLTPGVYMVNGKKYIVK